MIQLTDNILAFEVPIDAKKPYISMVNFVCYEQPHGYRKVAYNEPLDGTYEVLGFISKDEVDFECDELVSRIKNPVLLTLHYKDYRTDKGHDSYVGGLTPEGSFRTLLESKKQFFINPFGKEKPQHLFSDDPDPDKSEMYQKRLTEWQAAERSLIEKLIIVRKIDNEKTAE